MSVERRPWALEVAPYFRLDENQANNIISENKEAIQPWKDIAKSQGISNREITVLEPAFKV